MSFNRIYLGLRQQLRKGRNVRRLRASGDSDLGGYRYSAFGQTKEDTATLVQSLRWKARWHSTVNGAEVYDVRTRQWAPEIGAFISIDDYEFHDEMTTLWGWPNQNPIRLNDPLGQGAGDISGHPKDVCGDPYGSKARRAMNAERNAMETHERNTGNA